MSDKIKIEKGKIFIYNYYSGEFEETTNAELIGYTMLDIAEELNTEVKQTYALCL